MGLSASAVLAYGYDLGDTLTNLDEDAVRPAWMVDGYGDSVIGDALRALFTAAGGERAPDDYLDDEEVFELCGVMLAVYGSVDAPGTRVILAAKTFGANMDGPELVDLELPDGADWQLMCALRVLSIAPSEPKPRWILAASLG